MNKHPVVLVVAALVAVMAAVAPSGANPVSQRDMTKVIQQAPKRYLASEPGKTEQLTLLFGPYSVPPGQDSNRILADINLPAGFVKSVAPDLVDAASGRVPTEQEAHIHHAHWFRITDDPDELYYLDTGGGGVVGDALPDFVPPEARELIPANFGLSWVFGTGEEKTQGGFIPREALNDADANGVPDVQYGMEIEAGERQLVIFMIHNKTSGPLNVFVVLDVEFTHGTAEEITAATRIPMHPLKGQLWGRTKDALRDYSRLTSSYTAELDSTAIVAGGHAHPGVYENVLSNTGPGGVCSEDLDGDGYPGVALLHARKIDHVPGSWPYSEDFQMGVAKYGWRANIHAGDVLTQQAPYDIDNDTLGDMAADFALPGNYSEMGGPSAADLAGRDTVDGLPHQHYEAMNHYGMYVDPLQAPEPYLDANGDPWDAESGTCPANFAAVAAPSLLGEDTPAVQQRLSVDGTGIPPYFATGVNEGMQNHVWAALDPTCGEFEHATRSTCENRDAYRTDGSGIETDTITIAGFAYLPGDYLLPAPISSPARVQKGTTLTIYNADAAINVRHSLTTCTWPCTGTYVSNFPFPDGRIDTGKLGNFDPIDGGLTGDDTVPIYELDTTTMPTGWYSYYCRIHPFMRGAFELYE